MFMEENLQIKELYIDYLKYNFVQTTMIHSSIILDN